MNASCRATHKVCRSVASSQAILDVLVAACRYAVPRGQHDQLIGLLCVIEKATTDSASCPELAGIADVQLSLTSLEEVFLTIAKQVSIVEALGFANVKYG